MKKIVIVGAVVIIVGFLFLFISNDGGTPDVFIVDSDDGSLSISWPVDVFSGDISADDVSIVKKDAEGNIAVYEFLPEGAVFSEPGSLSLTIETPEEGEAFPLLVLVGEEGPEFIETQYEYSEDSDEMTITAIVPHFSRLVIVEGFFELIRPKEKALYAIGENFTLRIPIFVNLKANLFFEGAMTPFELINPKITHFGQGFDTVETDEFIEETEEAVISNFFTAVEEGFICKRNGRGTAAVQIDFDYSVGFHWGPPGNTEFFVFKEPHVTLNFLQLVSCANLEIEDEDESEGIIQSPELDFKGDSFKVLMLEFGDSYFPVAQFDVIDNPDSGCNYLHYRAKHDAIYGLENLNSTTIIESATLDISGCGLGRYETITRTNVVLSFEQVSALREKIPDRF